MWAYAQRDATHDCLANNLGCFAVCARAFAVAVPASAGMDQQKHSRSYVENSSPSPLRQGLNGASAAVLQKNSR